jgi:hypothetical protein
LRSGASLDLLLLALAGERSPECGWFNSIGLSLEQLRRVKQEQPARYARMRLLRGIGRLLERDDLLILLKARLAEQLLAAEGAGELEKLIRVLDKVPGPAGSSGQAAANAATAEDDDLEGMDLDTAVAEARQLLSALDRSADLLGEDEAEAQDGGGEDTP